MNKYLLFFVVVLFASCTSQENLYEQKQNLKKTEWHTSDYPEFDFTVADTTIAYNVYFVVRHLNTYKYNNLRVNIRRSSPLDSTFAATYNFNLGEESDWKGKQVNDLIEHRFRINEKPLMLNSVPYKYILQHQMLDKTLTGIMSVGIRIQKAN